MLVVFATPRAALHHPRAAAVRASAADKGNERDERAPAADEGEALCKQMAVEVAQARAAEQAMYLEAWQSATANSSDTGHFQAGVLGVVSLQLGWTALLVTAACGTGPVHDLILPWHQPISLFGSLLTLLEIPPDLEPGTRMSLEALDVEESVNAGWDAVVSGVPAFVQLWVLGYFAGTVTLKEMALNRFEPTKYLWLGASTLAVSWPVAVFCSCCAIEVWSAQMNQAAALTATEVIAVVSAHFLTAKHVDYERRGVDPMVFAELSKWNQDCVAWTRNALYALPVAWVLQFGLFGKLGKTLGTVVEDVAIASISIAFGKFLWLLLVKQALTRSSPDVFKEGDEGWPFRSLEDDYTSSAWEIYTWIILIGFNINSLVHNV